MLLLSLVLMLIAQIVGVVGHLRKDYRTIVGAVLSIISGNVVTTNVRRILVRGGEVNAPLPPEAKKILKI